MLMKASPLYSENTLSIRSWTSRDMSLLMLWSLFAANVSSRTDCCVLGTGCQTHHYWSKSGVFFKQPESQSAVCTAIWFLHISDRLNVCRENFVKKTAEFIVVQDYSILILDVNDKCNKTVTSHELMMSWTSWEAHLDQVALQCLACEFHTSISSGACVLQAAKLGPCMLCP